MSCTEVLSHSWQAGEAAQCSSVRLQQLHHCANSQAPEPLACHIGSGGQGDGQSKVGASLAACAGNALWGGGKGEKQLVG